MNCSKYWRTWMWNVILDYNFFFSDSLIILNKFTILLMWNSVSVTGCPLYSWSHKLALPLHFYIFLAQQCTILISMQSPLTNCIWQLISIEGTPAVKKKSNQNVLLKAYLQVLIADVYFMNNSNTIFFTAASYQLKRKNRCYRTCQSF